VKARQLLFCTPKGEKARRGVEGAGRGRRVTYSCTGLRDRPTGTVRDAVGPHGDGIDYIASSAIPAM
jgi:hypothetical protein